MMTKLETTSTTIRPAEMEDLKSCLNLDHSYLTAHVWQMDVHEADAGVAVNFRAVRLPRPVTVRYPRVREEMPGAWHRRDCFLVAEAGDSDMSPRSRHIVGYLTMDAYEWHKTGWVADLVVAPEHRRKGVATQLLQEGKSWARKTGLHRLTVETQTKNYPAICLLERLAFSFCGYSDQYYANRDIALFFSLDLH
jgi:ribosomal protein S18 acetylase RimI-like enzyme